MENSWIAEVIVQFSRSPVWRTPVNNFIDENCYIFDNDTEMKLEYTLIHKKFVQLIDTLLTDFVNELGVPAEEAMEALHKALAGKAEIGGQVDRFVSYIYGSENFQTFHKMMMRRNVELDILAMRALKEQGVDVNIPDLDDVLGAPPQSNNQRSAAMRENAGYDEEEALRLAIAESLKEQGMSGKVLELEDAQLQEALMLSKQAEAEKAKAQKKEVAKEVAIIAQTDPNTAAKVHVQKTAVIEQKEAQNVQALEEKTLRMREEKVREVVEQMHSPEVVPHMASAPAQPVAPAIVPVSATAGAVPTQPAPVQIVSQPQAPAQAPASVPMKTAAMPPPSFGGKTLGFKALPSLPSLGQPPLSAIKAHVEAEHSASSPTAPARQPTKEELEERARYMREQRQKILQRNKATRNKELEDYAKQNSMHMNVSANATPESEKQLTVDIARRLRGDILGELHK